MSDCMYNFFDEYNSSRSRSTAAPGEGPLPLPTPSLPSGNQPVTPGEGPFPFPTPVLPDNSVIVTPGEGPLPFPTPTLPDINQPVTPGEGPFPLPTPSLPSGGMPGYAAVRFLHATMNLEPVRVLIGNTIFCRNLSYGSMTGYGRVYDGFHTVTITSAADPRVVIYQASLPFNAGEVVTMAIVRAVAGVDIVTIPDIPCRNRPSNRAYIRTVNLVYNSPALDVLLSDGRLVFSDVTFKEATPFKMAMPRDYSFFVAQTPYIPTPYFSDIASIDEMPIVMPNYYLPGYGNVDVITSFFLNAQAGRMYTIYMLGEWITGPSIAIKIVENT